MTKQMQDNITKLILLQASATQSVPPSLAGGDFAYSPSTYEEQSVISPSLAEGARGWVNPTLESQAKLATASKGSTSSLQASVASAIKQGKAEVSLVTYKSKDKNIDCHENPCGFSSNDGFMDCLVVASPPPRNDEYDTHPQTPLVLRKVVLREAKTPLALPFCAKPQYDLQDK